MLFLYGDAIPFVTLRRASVNGREGWSIVLEWDDFGEEPEQELFLESDKDLVAFGERIAELVATREGASDV